MGKKLFVGGLPYETNDVQLKEMFGACGQVVSAKVIMDKATGRSKGFGFVEMTTDEEAKAVTEKLNNSSIGSRRIIVNEARPMEPRSAGDFVPRPGGSGDKNPGGGFGDRKPNFGDRKSSFGDRKGGGYDKKGGGKEGKKGGKGRRDGGGYDGW